MMLISKASRTLIDSGVDYVTATTTTRAGRAVFERVGFWELKKEESRGCDVKTYSAHGGQGIRCGSADFMAHPDYLMLRLSSHIAKERWREVVKHSTNVSRLDLQATVRFTPQQDNLAELVERRIRRWKLEHNRRLELELRRNDVKGKTLYTGSRSSDLFSRLYDKGRESRLEDYVGCWRLENQFNNRPAKAKAAELIRQPDADAYIVSQVARYYASRGAILLNPSLRILIVDKLRLESGRNSHDRLTWLRTQVRPTVQREVARGNLAGVLDALGLTDSTLNFNVQTKEED